MKVSSGLAGFLRTGWKVLKSAYTSSTRRPVIKVSQIEPVRADVTDRPQCTTQARFQPPVPIGWKEQPVLQIGALQDE